MFIKEKASMLKSEEGNDLFISGILFCFILVKTRLFLSEKIFISEINSTKFYLIKCKEGGSFILCYIFRWDPH